MVGGEPDDHSQAVARMVLEEDRFQQLTLSQPRGETANGWVKIQARPVLIKGRRNVQFNYLAPDRCITKNYRGRQLRRKLREALDLPFTRIHAQSTAGDLHVRITDKGKALVSRGKPSMPEQEPDLSHDRQKDYELVADQPDELLQALDVMTEDGRVRASMRGKFRQINEFLRVISRTVADSDWAADGIRMVDCGCGKAYLTFAAYHYLAHVCELPVRLVGVDVKAELIARMRELRGRLGWDELEFRVARIAEFTPENRPDVVLSLHACDTATDEALARGVEWRARVILAAPCCQHELHDQMDAPEFRTLTRHGILRERQADLVTDALRAAALRVMGYRTSVIEFVDPEATAKNLMIRAELASRPGHRDAVQEYRDLKEFWRVTPAIERMLAEPFAELLAVR